MAPRVAAVWLLLAAARAGDPQTCPAGRDCAPGEQDEAGLLQQSARFAAAKRHRHAVLVNKPNNADECKLVPNINTALPIVYDPSCPAGQCCFENTPCRYCNEGCFGLGACSAPTPTPARLAQIDSDEIQAPGEGCLNKCTNICIEDVLGMICLNQCIALCEKNPDCDPRRSTDRPSWVTAKYPMWPFCA